MIFTIFNKIQSSQSILTEKIKPENEQKKFFPACVLLKKQSL
jgi:hypothetical protein